MGNPKTDSGDKKNSSNSGSDSDQSTNSSASSKQNLPKLPPAGFIYSDDEGLMDELSMGWGLTANEEQDELDAIITKTVDMSKVSNTKLKALTEPPKSGVERIERVRAERASKEMPAPDISPQAVEAAEKSQKEQALKRAREAAAEKEAAAQAAAQREQAEKEYAAREAADREAARVKREEEERRQAEERARQEAEQRAREEAEREEQEAETARERQAREQEEEEAREHAERESRLLAAAREKEEREQDARQAAEARAKAEKDAREREEAEREIAERARQQKEAAAKLKAKQEAARREAEEQEALEKAAQEEAERQRLEREQAELELAKKEKAEQERAEQDKAARERQAKEPSKPSATRINPLGAKDKPGIKAQKIGLKPDDKKAPAAETPKSEPEKEIAETPAAQPTNDSGKSSTSKLSRTPEEELAALLAEDGHEPDALSEPKPSKPFFQDARNSRSGLAAMEPTDDTPLTGMLKVIKPSDRASFKAKEEIKKDTDSQPPKQDSIEQVEQEKTPIEEEVEPSEELAAKVAQDEEVAENHIESDKEDAGASKEFDAAAGESGLLSNEIVGSANSEPSNLSPEELEAHSAADETASATTESEVPDFLKTEKSPSVESKPPDKLQGVDKFYKPERVKLSDFVKKSKPAEAKEETAEAKPVDEAAKSKDTTSSDQLELPIENLPAKAESEIAAKDTARSAKDDIRESVKSESPEKKAAIIAALKKLEEQVENEGDLDNLSTNSLKDVLSKLPDLSASGANAVAGKKGGTPRSVQSSTISRLQSVDDSTIERDLAREKLKGRQKVLHSLPEFKTYLPQKRALLILVAVLLLGTLAAVTIVRAQTISAREALKKKDYTGALNSLGVALALYPFSSEGHFLRGSALYLSGNLKDAYSEYDAALKLSPDMREALARRGAVAYQLGNYSQSVSDYEKLLQNESVDSQSFDQLLSLANAYLKVGEFQKAADMYNRCLDKKDKYLPALIGKVVVSNEKKMYERAIVEAGKALAVSPNNKDVLLLRASAYINLHNFSQAQKDIESALKKAPKSAAVFAARAELKLAQGKTADAFADYETALKLSPKDASILLDRARAYLKAHKVDLAAKDIAKAKAILGPQISADIIIESAQVQIANKQAAKALEDLKAGQEKYPNDPDILLATADALAATGKLSDAIVMTEKAMDLDKDSIDAVLKHGLLSIKFGNKMRAAQDFADVIRLDPKNVTAYKTRGILFLQQEKYASAQEDLSKVIALDPTQTDAKEALNKAKTLFAKLTRVRSMSYQSAGPSDAYLAGLASKDFNTLLNDGYAAYKRGDNATAVPTLEQAVKVNPRDARARRYLAYAYKAADQSGEAASQFGALYPLGALSPQDISTYIDLLGASGQQEKASKILEEALAKAPGNQALYLSLAKAQAGAGEVPKAIQTCNRGIAINPRSIVGQQLIELRNNLMTNGTPDEQPKEAPGA